MSPAQMQKILQEAVALHRANRLVEAAAIYRRLLAAAPKNFDAIHLLGVVAYQQGKAREAIDLLKRALRIDPKSAVCEMRLGLAYAALGEHAQAISCHQNALKTQPSFAEVYDNLAYSLKSLGRLDEAIEAHRKAVELRPDFANAWNNLGLGYSFVGKTTDAIAAHKRALQLEPNNPRARFGYAVALQQAHRIPEAVTEYGRALELDAAFHEARSSRLMAMQYLEGIDRQEMFDAHLAFGKAVGRGKPRSFSNPRDPCKRLRIAFLSPDLRTHSVVFFVEPLLRYLDRANFEIYLYHDHAQVDSTSLRLKQMVHHWRNFVGQSNEVVEASILEDGPDILVDLAGHTGLNRLPVLAHRVAPIQIAYLGYPDTTGLAAMDYRLTDNIVDPDESADHYYTEKLIRFSSTAWVYQPPFDAPPATRIADEKPGIVFGSFNNFAKVSDTVLQLWSQVLRAVPNSRMVIKAQGLQDPLIRNWVLARMKTLDVAEDRLELLGRTAGVGSHLALYRKIDIALDSFPYHGTTTTCEALWMGVPVVTLLGDRHLSRVSASLLRAAHHPEWVAHSKEEYVRIASELAAAPERLVQIRSNLRSDLERGPLLDHAGQANRFGSVLRDMWAAHCAAEVSLKAS